MNIINNNYKYEAKQPKKRREISDLAQKDQDNCKRLLNIIHQETNIGFTLLPKHLKLTEKKISTIIVMYLTDKTTPRYFKSTQKRKLVDFIEANPSLKEALQNKHSDVLNFFLENADKDLWKKSKASKKLQVVNAEKNSKEVLSLSSEGQE